MQTLQREFRDGHPVSLGNGFELRKHKGDRELRAVCSLQTHQLGCEFVLEVNGVLSRSQVCRSRDEVLDTCEHWHIVMIQAGWTRRDQRDARYPVKPLLHFPMSHQMRSTLRCLLACALCVLLPAIGHAGPMGDALRDVSAKQAAPAPGKSRQGVWVGGIVLTVVGGAMMIGGRESRHKARRARMREYRDLRLNSAARRSEHRTHRRRGGSCWRRDHHDLPRAKQARAANHRDSRQVRHSAHRQILTVTERRAQPTTSHARQARLINPAASSLHRA